MPEKISVLVITYNRPLETLELLESIKNQDQHEAFLGEVLLLNNASTVDYSIIHNFIKNHPELPITYIDHSENLGVARGRNYLIERANFPLLLILDDDIEFSKTDDLKKIAQVFEKPYFIEKNTGIITFSIFYHATKQRQVNAFPHKNVEKHLGKDWFFTNYFAGGGHLIKKEVFDKTGLYPTGFFYGMEEYDLAYRAIDAGYALGYYEDVMLLHKESPLGRVPNSVKLSMMWYNKCVVAWRYLPKKYFRSTAALWSLFFLKNSKFDFKTFVSTWKKIRQIPKLEKRTPIGAKALQYLKSVEARLTY